MPKTGSIGGSRFGDSQFGEQQEDSGAAIGAPRIIQRGEVLIERQTTPALESEIQRSLGGVL